MSSTIIDLDHLIEAITVVYFEGFSKVHSGSDSSLWVNYGGEWFLSSAAQCVGLSFCIDSS